MIGVIRHSIGEIRHILARTVLTAVSHTEHVLSWTRQRLIHQTQALISHYRRRGDPIPFNLRM